MKIQNLIIGCGLTGIVLARRIAEEKNEEVLIVEKRNHIGGNCYDYYDENGILIHAYGPHIFHTNYEDVWEFVNRFSEFTNYQHKVIGFVDGNLIPIPFNINSIYKIFGNELAKDLEKTLLKYFSYGQKVSIIELRKKAREINNDLLNFLADYIFEKVFKNYTIKQWGISPDEISENVLLRVPVVISKDDRYFPGDRYQGMPKYGYTKMFEKMLDHKKIKIMLNTDYKDIVGKIEYQKLYFTGSIDEFFDYKYGKLDYKKTLYKFETYDIQLFQCNAVINYPNDYEWTRITEFKYFYKNSYTFNINKTVICKEIPGIGDIEAYPVETNKNLELLEKYKNEAKKFKNVYFLGRLGQYKYFNMDQAIKNVLDFNL